MDEKSDLDYLALSRGAWLVQTLCHSWSSR